MMTMDPFLPAYVLSIFLLPVLSLYLISFLSKRNSTGTKNLPPAARCCPMLGETVAYAFSGSEKFVEDRMEKCPSSDVIQTSLYGERMAIFCGPRANKFLFTNESTLVSAWWPRSTRKVIFSPEFLNTEFKQAPNFYNDILKTEALKRYITVMDAHARQHMDQDWTPNNVVKVLPSARMYTFELACRLFLRVVGREEVKKMLDSFTLVTSGMYSIPVNFPGTDYNRAIKGGIALREQIMRIVKERRKELMLMEPKAEDLLSKLLLATDSSEMEICNYMVGLLLASFDTTSSAVTSVMNYLASLPQIYEQVLKEQMEIVKLKGPDELLTWEDIEKMKFTWNVVRESLRLMPPGQGGFKVTRKEFAYEGFTIPRGWKIFWTGHSSHKNPKYFPEPEKFDPSRFEGSGPAPYTFVPFGGGPRMCPGREFARIEILVFIHNVVRRFKLEKMFPDEKIVFKYSKPVPVYGLPVRLRPHDT